MATCIEAAFPHPKSRMDCKLPQQKHKLKWIQRGHAMIHTVFVILLYILQLCQMLEAILALWISLWLVQCWATFLSYIILIERIIKTPFQKIKLRRTLTNCVANRHIKLIGATWYDYQNIGENVIRCNDSLYKISEGNVCLR